MLYHMPKSLEFLTLVPEKTDKLFLWTHFVLDEGYPPDAVYAPAITGVDETEFRGRTYTSTGGGTPRRRATQSSIAAFTETPPGCRAGEILQALCTLGFSDLRIGFENALHENGPCFALVAHR
jgi:hypothetical protein